LGFDLGNSRDGLDLFQEFLFGGMSTVSRITTKLRSTMQLLASASSQCFSYSPFFPWSKVLKRNSGHELEVQAASTDQTVDSDSITDLLEFRKVLVNDLGDGFQRFRSSLISIVLASPFSANAVEGHGAVGQWDIRVKSHVLASRKSSRGKSLNRETHSVRI
jgi:hypothetical protein